MALTSVATEGGMGDTTFMAIVSARDILELAMPSADSMEVGFTEAVGTAVAGTGRRGAVGETHHLFARAVFRVALCNRTRSMPKVPDHSGRDNFCVRARLLR